MTMPPALRIANTVMLALFLLAAAVQYNDPDPFPWVLVYAGAAAACAMAFDGSRRWQVPAALAATALVWALALAARIGGNLLPEGVFASASMIGPDVETAREAGGLLLVAAWSAFLAVLQRNAVRRVAAGRDPGRHRTHTTRTPS